MLAVEFCSNTTIHIHGIAKSTIDGRRRVTRVFVVKTSREKNQCFSSLLSFAYVRVLIRMTAIYYKMITQWVIERTNTLIRFEMLIEILVDNVVFCLKVTRYTPGDRRRRRRRYPSFVAPRPSVRVSTPRSLLPNRFFFLLFSKLCICF